MSNASCVMIKRAFLKSPLMGVVLSQKINVELVYVIIVYL